MVGAAGEVYSETVIHLAPASHAADAPYQVVIVTLDSGGRVTGRVLGERLAIGDRVTCAETRGKVPFFARA